MSRSVKKHPFTSHTTATSEKQDKRFANRRERRLNKTILNTTFDESQLKRKREVSDVWGMSKDGKIRFDPRLFPQYLRK